MSMHLRKSDGLRCSGKRSSVAAALTLFLASAAVGATPVSPIEDSMALKCQVTSNAIMTGDSQDIKVKVPPASNSLTLDVVNGQLLTAAPERAKLRLLSTEKSSGSMFFEELTGTGNVALWSFHRLRNGRILFSQQMSASASGPTQEKVVLFTQAGYCDATGGNGRPIHK
jgi:hypothetical protein